MSQGAGYRYPTTDGFLRLCLSYANKRYVFVYYIRMKNLRSLSGTARRLRGLLRSAVSDLTILRAACFAFRPALIAEAESADDTDFSEEVDGERECFWFAMIARLIKFFSV